MNFPRVADHRAISLAAILVLFFALDPEYAAPESASAACTDKNCTAPGASLYGVNLIVKFKSL